MVDPIAVCGAITGTAGLGIAARREVANSRRRLRVERGWHFAFDQEGEAVTDVWVYVMAWNAGGRSLSIEHCGFGWLENLDHEQLERDHGVSVHPVARPVQEVRAEKSILGQDPIEVTLDGPTVKVLTRIGPLLHLGLDPFTDPVAPFVVTAAQRYWWGSPGPLLPRSPARVDREQVRAELDRIRSHELGRFREGVPASLPACTRTDRPDHRPVDPDELDRHISEMYRDVANEAGRGG